MSQCITQPADCRECNKARGLDPAGFRFPRGAGVALLRHLPLEQGCAGRAVFGEDAKGKAVTWDGDWSPIEGREA